MMNVRLSACAAVLKMTAAKQSAPKTVRIVQPPVSPQRSQRNADNARAKLKAPLTGQARLRTMPNGVLVGFLLAGRGLRCLEHGRHTALFFAPVTWPGASSVALQIP